MPWGGGGLRCGVAAAVRALAPKCPVYAAEVETAAPLAASLAAEEPREVSYTPGFVGGIGAPLVFPEMFDLGRRLVAGSLVAPLQAVAEAVRLLAERNRVIAEGAAAVPVAAALAGMAGTGKVVCVVSGDNIDPDKLTTILQGTTPTA